MWSSSVPHCLGGGRGLFVVWPGCSAWVVGMVSREVISLVFSVVSLSALDLLAESVVSSITRSLCFVFNFVWFRRALLLVCFLVDCGLAVFFARLCRSMLRVLLILPF